MTLGANEQGATYAAFIDDQLKAELARRSSLDERGTKLQQSASLTVALFAAAFGLLLGKEESVAGWPLWVLAGSGAVLLIAFLMGVLATRLVYYAMPDDNTYDKMVGEQWTDDEIDSRNITAWLNAQTITALRPGNNTKAAFLSRGIMMQGVGVLLGVVAFVGAALTMIGVEPQPPSPPQPTTVSASASPTVSTPTATTSASGTPEPEASGSPAEQPQGPQPR